jgi:hypothetical protein
MLKNKKAAPCWQREAASNTHSHYAPHGIDPIPERQPRRRQPAYARQLIEAARQGYVAPWLLISLSWDLGIAVPRVVVPADVHAAELDLTCVAGIECLVAHHGEPSRAIDVAERALAAGATVCPVLDVAAAKLTATTAVLRRVAA